MRLLSGMPESVLWLSGMNVSAMRNLRREAEQAGIAPERLLFAPFVETSEAHLARLGLADLFLDTVPCNAHTTANDALRAGVPVLTCKGGTFAGRVAASLLAAATLPDMVAESLSEYENRALALARDTAALANIKARLHEALHHAPLFDTARFTRNLERAFATMLQHHVEGKRPAAFSPASV
jgi:predicted O-linked N-acetylglucosamine transferase (SPINDLY family)